MSGAQHSEAEIMKQNNYNMYVKGFSVSIVIKITPITSHLVWCIYAILLNNLSRHIAVCSILKR